MPDSTARAVGEVTVELFDKDGNLKSREVIKNLITTVGDILYTSRGSGLTTSALPIGMKLGTGSTAVAKTGAGAGLVTYLTNSHQAFDATFPSMSSNTVTYKVTYAAGKATSAGAAITEVVIYTDATADATSTVANTISRAIVGTVPSKQSTDTLVVTWTHTITGA